MSQAESNPGKPVSLEQFIAFNMEMSALARAGIPLELGLRQASIELQGKLRHMTTDLADSLERGDSLVDALGKMRHPPPPAYQALVQAGIRSGNLSLALENVTDFANGMLDLRRQITLTFLYPLIVLSLAYGLFLFVAVRLFSDMAGVFRSFGSNDDFTFSILEAIGSTASIWGPILPCFLLIIVLWWWYTGLRHHWLGTGGPLSVIPGIRNLLIWGQLASFSDLLATLIAHQVPVDEAFVLSAHATGSRRLQRDARRFVAATQEGAGIAESLNTLPSIPAYLKWSLSSAQSPEFLVPSLRQAAQFYRRRTREWIDFLRVFMPPLMVVAIGGTATALYAFSVFLPVIRTLSNLSSFN